MNSNPYSSFLLWFSFLSLISTLSSFAPLSVPLLSFSYSSLLLSLYALSVPSLSAPLLHLCLCPFPPITHLSHSVSLPLLVSHFLSPFHHPVIAHGGMPESRPPSLTLSLRWPPAGQHCPHTAVQLWGVVSIHTYLAIKLWKRELVGRELDALQIYITAEAAREEIVREREEWMIHPGWSELSMYSAPFDVLWVCALWKLVVISLPMSLRYE